jgi:hypothetical protein
LGGFGNKHFTIKDGVSATINYTFMQLLGDAVGMVEIDGAVGIGGLLSGNHG